MDRKIINFYEKGDNYFEFSNFYLAPVEIDGKSYLSSEHAYQASKFLGPDATDRSKKYAEEIRKVNTPNKSRILASQKRVGGYKWKTDLNPTIEKYSDVKLRTDWESSKDNVMRLIVLAKFSQHSNLRSLLLNTNDAIIQENSPRDSYWGIGKDGKGNNMLGIILMETRDTLRNAY